MSISLVSSPQFYMPAYNPVVWVVNSTNNTKCSFQYGATIQVNGNTVANQILYPDINGNGTFEIQRVLQDYVSADLFPNLVGATGCLNSNAQYRVVFSEIWDGSTACDGSGLTSSIGLTSSYNYIWNAALQYSNWPSFNYQIYDGTTGPGLIQFLTDATNTTQGSYIEIGNNDQYVLTYLDDTSLVTGMNIMTYDTHFNQIGLYSTAFSISQDLVSVGVGPGNINSLTSYSTFLGPSAQPLINLNVAYYAVNLFKSFSGVDVCSETRWFGIDNRPSLYTPTRFTWLNKLGGMDSYSFNLSSNRNTPIARKEFTQLLGSLNTSNQWTYKIGDRGRRNIQVTATETYTVTSDWVSQSEAFWMESLFQSPQVYLMNSDRYCVTPDTSTTNFDPIILTSATYDEKLTQREVLLNYDITFEKAYNVNVQRG